MSFIYDIVIIGAGPGGIASVVEAEKADITNTLVIEKMGNHSYMIEKFYKKGKRVDKDWQGKKFEFIGNVTFEECSKEEFIDQMEELIQEEGVADKFLYNQEIYGVQKNENGLFELDTHNHGVIEAKNVIIAIGRMGKPNKPGYKFPAKLRKVLNFNLSDVKPGEKVMVVGGGDTAGEYAYGLVDMDVGCDVTLNYRRPDIFRMNPTNQEILYKYADEGKLKLKLGVDVENVEVDPDTADAEQPKVKVNFKDGTSEVYDRVVYALGGTSPKDFLKNSNIEMNEWGEPIVNEETMETNIEGLYAIGDVVTSAGSIALAFNHAYLAVQDIAKKLKAQ